MQKISVGLIDDHKIVRDGVKLLLLGKEKYTILFEATTAMEMLSHLNTTKPDLLLLDLNLPGLSGLDVIETVFSKYPQIKILVLSANCDENSILSAIDKGVQGYISKDADSEELLKAIEVITEGEEFFGETVSKIVYQSFLKKTKIDVLSDPSNPNFTVLSERELDVLKCFAEGMSYKQAADFLHISPRTVETHRVNIMKKLEMENLAQLIKYAVRNGIVSL